MAYPGCSNSNDEKRRDARDAIESNLAKLEGCNAADYWFLIPQGDRTACEGFGLRDEQWRVKLDAICVDLEAKGYPDVFSNKLARETKIKKLGEIADNLVAAINADC